MEASDVRKLLRQKSLRIISAYARNAKRGAFESWKELLEDVEDFYHYDAWDLLFVLAYTLATLPKTGLPPRLRQEAAELRRRRKKAFQELKRFRARWMTREHPLFERLELTEARYPVYDRCSLGGVHLSGF